LTLSPWRQWAFSGLAVGGTLARWKGSKIGSLVRSAGAVFASLVVAAVLMGAVEVFGSILHPFPPEVDPTDCEACKAHVARYPAWVLAVAVLALGPTTFLRAWLATRLGPGRRRAHGVVMGLILPALVGAMRPAAG
jgi:hypothetical protein